MRMLLFVSVLALAAAGPIQDELNPELDEHWEDYMRQYNKQYKSEIETHLRRLMWEKNLKYVQEHNLQADMGHHTFWLGMNEHADLSDEEFSLYQRGYIMRNESTGSAYLSMANVQAPDNVDWRTEGYVTEVKNQKQCGSCWAFSTTGSLEGQLYKKTGKLVSLSEQQLVDCSKENHGCGGGLMDLAFKYIKENGGIDTEESYPYMAKNEKCHFKRQDVAGSDTGFVDIPRGDEQALMEAVATVGPISVAIDAGHKSFQLYKHGVYMESECSASKLDHGVLVVGYGELDGEKYWLVKNSWGSTWGNDGYIMMRRDYDNMCGIATQASYPLV